MEKEFKIGDLVGYPRTCSPTPILCLIIMVTQKPYQVKQYILESITTGERYVAVKRWLTLATSETQ